MKCLRDTSLLLSLLYYLYISPCQTLFEYFHAEGEGLAKEEMESSQYTVSNSLLALECGRKLSFTVLLHIPLPSHPHSISLFAITLQFPYSNTYRHPTSLRQRPNHRHPSPFIPLHPNLQESHIPSPPITVHLITPHSYNSSLNVSSTLAPP